ncbi:YdeI/OmpD-associated family protein [Xanthomonas phaseoli]|uniref:YdeI/OmpD-associated family protein n=1 Tax=Xanthomonas phaseoli TaxID=1985254 RepID=UPI0004CDE2E4|nr:YdeI/OmpD-associated family protein [Xanthomonas phaseoli]
MRPAAAIRFTATLLQPATPADATWLFLLLPAAASDALPTRSMASVTGTLAGHPLQATLQPDGRGGHWLATGQTVALVLTPVAEEPEPVVPDDLHAALAAHPAARATWNDITAVARRDWILWVVSGKKAQTRGKRIATACAMLASGKRRACCFDRSGKYSHALAAPTPKAG